jgi:hypothetical protein
LANPSYRLGRELKFDPEKEVLLGDSEADRMVSRKPYIVPEKV